MTVAEWLEQAKRDRGTICSLIANFHPVRRSPGPRPTDHITASNAERACAAVRATIRDKEAGSDPIADFNTAIDSGDWQKAMGILSSTWFGVPESTSCWQLVGFAEAVGLMEDPPET